MKHITLNNGTKVPMLGLGTYNIGKTENDVYVAIRFALDAGYRHIDTAAMYGNEVPIGKAIKESGIPREEIFVTTKLWGDDVINNNVQKAFEKSLKKLDTDYIDLYLVHWPVKGKHVWAWQEMERIYISGKAKAVGVSNHMIHHLTDLLQIANIVPAVNQVELHPYLVQQDLIDFCKQRNIAPEAWSPLGSSKTNLLDEETLTAIAEKYEKTAAQVILRWNIEKGCLTIPKSSDPERQAANIDIFDFELSPEEIQAIDSLDKSSRTGVHPDEIEF